MIIAMHNFSNQLIADDIYAHYLNCKFNAFSIKRSFYKKNVL